MSEPKNPQPDPQKRHREKPTMSEPQEEFVGDEAQPSKDISEVAPAARPAKTVTP